MGEPVASINNADDESNPTIHSDADMGDDNKRTTMKKTKDSHAEKMSAR
jgi:hypothetical protein